MSLPTAETPQLSESLQGTVERITFHSEESGFCVFKIKCRGRRELQTVVGQAAKLSAGEFVDCAGHWHNDRMHGLQFKATQIESMQPTTVDGMEKYLASGMIKGIGPTYAKRMVETFKTDVFHIIETAPERLAEVPGLGKKRIEKILAAWEEQKCVRDIMVFLQSHGVGTSRAVRIYKQYGDRAIATVKANPYCLANDIRGIGFKSADDLAQRLGFTTDCLPRLQAGVVFQLQQLSSQGHCGYEEGALQALTAELLDVEPELISDAIAAECEAGHLVPSEEGAKTFYYLRNLHYSEKGIAYHCQRLMQGKVVWQNIEHDKAIAWVEDKTGLELSPSQQQAVVLALKNKVAIITGGPGVGKTTIVNSIIRIIRAKRAKVLLVAPTGRAAKRLSESSKCEAKTIHRLLEFNPTSLQFNKNHENPLDADYVVIDECSMVDVTLMNQLLRAIPDHAGVLFVGDVDQLPSVGPGAVLQDLIASREIATARLTEIFRQAKTSQIITNAHRINAGHLPHGGEQTPDTLTDFYVVTAKEVDELQQKLLHMVCQRIPQRFGLDPKRDIQVLTPSKRGAIGTVALNLALQQRLNPQQQRIERFGQPYSVGDKVIQMVNNYDKDVFNGDIGTISGLDVAEELFWIDFDGKRVEYQFNELDELALAYAVTIHKSQGSEYPAVVIPVSTQHFTLLQRNLLYTGVTRGKKLVVLVGQSKAMHIAVNTNEAQERVTLLQSLLLEDI